MELQRWPAASPHQPPGEVDFDGPSDAGGDILLARIGQSHAASSLFVR